MRYYVYQQDELGNEYRLADFWKLEDAIKRAQKEWDRLTNAEKKENKVYVCKYRFGTIEMVEKHECWDCDTYIWGLANRDEIKDKLCDMLAKIESDRCPYQRDIYLYVDECGNGKLEFYDNVGGNSWCNDSHYAIHSGRQYAKSEIFNVYTSVTSIADDTGISEDELRRLAGVEDGMDEIEAYRCVQEYVTNDADLSEKLDEAYEEYCKEYDWSEEADRILDEWYAGIIEKAAEQDQRVAQAYDEYVTEQNRQIFEVEMQQATECTYFRKKIYHACDNCDLIDACRAASAIADACH